jgi:hypothetical protein
MKLEERPTTAALGTILAHNASDTTGRRVLKKGTRLAPQDLAVLAGLGRQTVTVAVLEADDVHEDEAAAALGAALQTEHLRPDPPGGGRVNLHATVDGVLEVDARRLLELNRLSGITLATRPPYTLVGPAQETDVAGTLKIIPYAVPRADLDRALGLARAGLLALRPLPRGRRVALLITAEPSAQDRVGNDFLPPTRARVERLGAELASLTAVPETVGAIRQAASRLAGQAHLLIIAGQTSIMDEDDTTLRALREAGAEGIVHGAPVEPGNLLALAYFPATGTPVLCAPGCARSPRPNVVDLVLPRLLSGERLGRDDIAALGLGGLLG